MFQENNLLIPEWKKKFSNINCGYTLPEFGNMALTRQSISKKQSTVENRKDLSKALNINVENFFYMHQIHSDRVIIVDKESSGKGAVSLDEAFEGDSCVSKEKNILLLVTWADCIPIILYEPKQSWIGAIHSGWKGTAKNILGETINILKKNKVDPNDIFLSIGPGIRDCCYEVSKNFIDNFKSQYFLEFFKNRENSYFFDLAGSVLKQALNNGIKRENIDFYGKCNCCSENPSFFSFRKDKDKFEAQAAFIGKI